MYGGNYKGKELRNYLQIYVPKNVISYLCMYGRG